MNIQQENKVKIHVRKLWHKKKKSFGVKAENNNRSPKIILKKKKFYNKVDLFLCHWILTQKWQFYKNKVKNDFKQIHKIIKNSNSTVRLSVQMF